MKLGEMIDADKVMGEIQQTSGSGLMWQSGFESQITFCMKFCLLAGVCSL